MIGLPALAHWAAKQPQAVAITAGDEYITYGDLLDRCRRLANRLNRYLPADERILGVAMSDGIEFYLGVLACWMTGRAYVPLRMSDPPVRNAGIIQMLEVQSIFSPKGTTNTLNNWRAVRVIDTHDLPTESPLPDWQPLVSENDLAYVLFTSGSTGQPKGVPISWGNLNAFSEAILETNIYDFSPSDRFLQAFQPTFDLSVFSFWIPLQAGASVHVVPQTGQVAFNISYVLEEKQITVALLTPSVLAYLRPYFADLQLPALRLSLFCGEALPHELTAEWAGCVPQARIENVYGPTEATIFCSRYVWEADRSALESAAGIVPIGTALPGMTLCIDSSDGDTGELLLAGPQVFSGYWRNDERTRQVLTFTDTGERVYRSGDRCRRLTNGIFQYLERVDFQIKIDGYRIELGEIEYHARRLNGGELAAAVVLDAQPVPVLALLVLGNQEVADRLAAELKSCLPFYMLPQKIIGLEHFPLTSSGKIDRQALAAQARQSMVGALGLT